MFYTVRLNYWNQGYCGTNYWYLRVDHWGNILCGRWKSLSLPGIWIANLFLLRNETMGIKWVVNRSLKVGTLKLLLHLFADLGCFFACELTSRAEPLPYWELLCFPLCTSPYFPVFLNVAVPSAGCSPVADTHGSPHTRVCSFEHVLNAQPVSLHSVEIFP